MAAPTIKKKGVKVTPIRLKPKTIDNGPIEYNLTADDVHEALCGWAIKRAVNEGRVGIGKPLIFATETYPALHATARVTIEPAKEDDPT